MDIGLKLIKQDHGSMIIGAIDNNGLNHLWPLFAFDNASKISRKLIDVKYEQLQRLLGELIDDDPKQYGVAKVWCLADGSVYMFRLDDKYPKMSQIEIRQ